MDRIRILVVDDDVDNADTLTKLLKLKGYDVHECVHGPDCLEAVERLLPEVILLDLGMAGMSGFDIAEELRENPDLRPRLLIAVTGHGQPADFEHTKNAGFDHHLLKPLDWRKLDAILQSREVPVGAPRR